MNRSSALWPLMSMVACALLYGCTKLDNAADIIRPFPVQQEPDDAAIAPRDGASQAGMVDANATVDAAALDAGHDAASADCLDPTGFAGLGCYQCPPTDIVTLENACTEAKCTPFDNALRLMNLGTDGALPALPTSAARMPSDGNPGPQADVPGVGTACADLASQGTVVYVTGSSAAKPFLQQIGQQLAGQGVYLVYTSTGSCVGVDAILNGTPMRTGAAPLPASALYWDATSSAGNACDLPAGGVAADLGISDVFAQTCPGFELANIDALKIRDAHGPIQTMTFVVPASSAYSEISAQAAYFVYGFGQGGGVLDARRQKMIWNDESLILQRSGSSGTQAMLAAAIGVPAQLWKGQKHSTSDDVATSLQAAGASRETADKAIGILAADYVDSRNLRAQIRSLAFKDSRQNCAFYPDSSDTARDKQNVRDGHYPIWGPIHLLHKVDASGNPQNPVTRAAVNDVLGYLSGTKALPNGIKLIDIYAQSGLIPECAMGVARQQDGGSITPTRPSNPCSCLFEAKATGATDCSACKVQGDCGTGETCSQGYCEPA